MTNLCMADRGFKIKEDLMMLTASLCIPPSSSAASMQMLPSYIGRHHVEQAIGRLTIGLKVFRILKHELCLSLLPIVVDIMKVCCSLCNILPPLNV